MLEPEWTRISAALVSDLRATYARRSETPTSPRWSTTCWLVARVPGVVGTSRRRRSPVRHQVHRAPLGGRGSAAVRDPAHPSRRHPIARLLPARRTPTRPRSSNLEWAGVVGVPARSIRPHRSERCTSHVLPPPRTPTCRQT
ncbi:hypothetical protein [Jiangella gansuensis]|uniref:hypothetical protein n=1 Tax=Jiangella gansuensis TaxID=281473 RepID=UPI00316AD706